MLEQQQLEDFCLELDQVRQQVKADYWRTDLDLPVPAEIYRHLLQQLQLAIEELELCFAQIQQQQADWQALQSRHEDLVQLNTALQQELAERKRMEALLKHQAQRERLIDSIAYRIRQSLDLDEILTTAVDEVRHFLQVDRVVIYRFKPDWSGVVTVESVARPSDSILFTHIEEPCFRNDYVPRYQQGRVRAVNDVDTADIAPCHRQLLKQYGVRANLVVPIVQGDVLWGLLIAHHCRTPRHWEQTDATLLRRLSTQIAIAIQQSQLYGQVQQLATTDALTRVANRRQFEAYYEQVWRQLLRNQGHLSLVICDIDFFKPYNDTYGHPAGDVCLEQIADVLKSVLKRSGDFVARYGGEEFVIILPETDRSGAQYVVDDIMAKIRTLGIEHATSPLGQVTLSLGGVSLIPDAEHQPQAVFKAADNALYQAKNQGRDQAILISLQGKL